jgi:DNA-directed RNA polymerase specialized sigma24 family protein
VSKLTPEAVVQDYSRLVRKLAFQIARSLPDRTIYAIEDLYQIGVEAVLTKLPVYRARRSKPTTFVWMVVQNRFRDLLDKERVRYRLAPMDTRLREYQPEAPGELGGIAMTEAILDLKRELSRQARTGR